MMVMSILTNETARELSVAVCGEEKALSKMVVL
jgi:hypothetical protein